MTKRAWLVLPDLLSIRVFFDTGIATGLHERLGGRLAAVFLVPRDAAAEWLDRVPGLDVLHGDELTAGDGLPDRALARVDATLDRQLGYHPLAIRLNHRHGFHAERMQPGHPNWMLDTNRDSRLPHRPRVERAMERWFFSPRRHVPAAVARGDEARLLGPPALERAAHERRAVPHGGAASVGCRSWRTSRAGTTPSARASSRRTATSTSSRTA